MSYFQNEIFVDTQQSRKNHPNKTENFSSTKKRNGPLSLFIGKPMYPLGLTEEPVHHKSLTNIAKLS